jgi:hypothetical protein
MYKHAKKDVPKVHVAELVRDFRIDEEDGMLPDPKLEAKDINIDKRNLVDNID